MKRRMVIVAPRAPCKEPNDPVRSAATGIQPGQATFYAYWCKWDDRRYCPMFFFLSLFFLYFIFTFDHFVFLCDCCFCFQGNLVLIQFTRGLVTIGLFSCKFRRHFHCRALSFHSTAALSSCCPDLKFWSDVNWNRRINSPRGGVEWNWMKLNETEWNWMKLNAIECNCWKLLCWIGFGFDCVGAVFAVFHPFPYFVVMHFLNKCLKIWFPHFTLHCLPTLLLWNKFQSCGVAVMPPN